MTNTTATEGPCEICGTVAPIWNAIEAEDRNAAESCATCWTEWAESVIDGEGWDAEEREVFLPYARAILNG